MKPNYFYPAADILISEGSVPQDFIDDFFLNQSFESNLTEFFTDINILLPPQCDRSSKEVYISTLALCCHNYEISETKALGLYRLKITLENGSSCYFDQIEQVDEFITPLAVNLIQSAFHLYSEEKIEDVEEIIRIKAHNWNFSRLVAQEWVFALSRTLPLSRICLIMDCPEDIVMQILTDYHQRTNVKKLENLKSFEKRIYNLISDIGDNNKKLAKSLQFLLEEINNGGDSIKTNALCINNCQPIQNLFSLS